MKRSKFGPPEQQQAGNRCRATIVSMDAAGRESSAIYPNSSPAAEPHRPGGERYLDPPETMKKTASPRSPLRMIALVRHRQSAGAAAWPPGRVAGRRGLPRSQAFRSGDACPVRFRSAGVVPAALERRRHAGDRNRAPAGSVLLEQRLVSPGLAAGPIGGGNRISRAVTSRGIGGGAHREIVHASRRRSMISAVSSVIRFCTKSGPSGRFDC